MRTPAIGQNNHSVEGCDSQLERRWCVYGAMSLAWSGSLKPLAESYTKPKKGKAGGVVVVAIDLPTESSSPPNGGFLIPSPKWGIQC